jgi:transposase
MAELSFCGIDVSKNRLNVVVLPAEYVFSAPNDVTGLVELVSKLRCLSVAAIGIEASVGYERSAVRALLAAGFSVRQINPFKLRQFAKGQWRSGQE